mmetsp:Transcript_8634/g.10072  ORF Transcript_8634/g.10072 Transcript_8634/m.10072 type:complete len:138 (+) Transcript_8634:1879-2292(+)
MIEEKTENTQAVNRVVQVPAALLPAAGAVGKTMTDSLDLAKTTSLARIVPRAAHEEDQVQERARREILGTIMIALSVAVVHVLESEAVVKHHNQMNFKENEHRWMGALFEQRPSIIVPLGAFLPFPCNYRKPQCTIG